MNFKTGRVTTDSGKKVPYIVSRDDIFSLDIKVNLIYFWLSADGRHEESFEGKINRINDSELTVVNDFNESVTVVLDSIKYLIKI